MRIVIQGESCPVKTRILRECVRWVLCEKISKDSTLYTGVNITVKFTDTVHQIDAVAKIENLDEGEQNPRRFRISLSDNQRMVCFMKTLVCLCHELMHVHQYRTNDLWFDENNNAIVYKGVSYPYGETEYDEEPWEWDAFAREKLLAGRFCKDHGYHNFTWYHEL